MGASPTSLVVNSADRISSVCSSIPMWILRQSSHRFEKPRRRTFAAAVLAGVPFPFALDLDVCAVDQEVQGALRSAICDVDLQGLPVAARRAEVRRSPVQVDQPLLREWACGLAYASSLARNNDLTRWLDWFTRARPLSALNGLPPFSRVNNPLRIHS